MKLARVLRAPQTTITKMEAMFAVTPGKQRGQKLTGTYAVNTLLGPRQASEEEEVREHSWDRGMKMSQNLLVGLVL